MMKAIFYCMIFIGRISSTFVHFLSRQNPEI
jgi:hypothetical protein